MAGEVVRVSGGREAPNARSAPSNGSQLSVVESASGDRASLRYANGRVKRAFDLMAGVVLSVVTAPIVVVVAIASAVSLRAWPLFVQQRLGRNGRPFRFVKVRSLPIDTPASACKYTIAEVSTTRVGRFLRSSHLDELPQCWLMVTGRMSLVGPRPEMPELSATFDPVFVAERLSVRPGITGPWQVSPAVSGLIGEAPEYDRFYLDHAGPRLDAWLCLRTIGGFVGLRPVSLDHFPTWVGNGSAPSGTPTDDSVIAGHNAHECEQLRP